MLQEHLINAPIPEPYDEKIIETSFIFSFFLSMTYNTGVFNENQAKQTVKIGGKIEHDV